MEFHEKLIIPYVQKRFRGDSRQKLNSKEEVMKKQILYYQKHPEEYLELVYDNLHLFKYQKLLLKMLLKIGR